MSCYIIEDIINVPSNGDCMFESIWNSLDAKLRGLIIHGVHIILEKQTDIDPRMDTYIEPGKEYRFLRILCNFYEISPEEFPNVNTLRDNNANDADKNIFDLNGKERWGDSAEIFIITSFLKKNNHNIQIQVYQKQEGDCYRLIDFDKIVDETVYKEIYLIFVGRNHYKYTLTKPKKVVGDVAVVGVGDGLGDGAVIGKEGVGGVKTKIAPIIVLSIFVLFMAAVSG